MSTKVGRILAAVVAVGGMLMTGGCSSPTCSSVLWSDQVVVHFSSYAHTADVSTVRACIGNVCNEERVDPTRSDLMIPVASGSGQVEVSVTGRSGAGAQLFDDSTTVTTVLGHPDGPDCQSIHQAEVTVTDSGLFPTN